MYNLDSIEIGIGTAAWGDHISWGFGNHYTEADLKATFNAITASHNVLIDTAEIYGMGQSEKFIGRFSTESNTRSIVATKFFPFPWRLTPKALKHALRQSLQRLQRAQVDLYQIHWNTPPVSIETWMQALALATETGLTRLIGVSNYTTQQTLSAASFLEKRGLTLASNQVKYSLLDRTIERNGLLELCKELDVRVIAYSPLEQGLLTGKYTPSNSPQGLRKFKYNRHFLTEVQPLINMMREIGKAYAENGVIKTPAQVALNWCICKGTIPIPGAKNEQQALQNLGAVGWRLAPEEIEILDHLSDKFYKTVRL